MSDETIADVVRRLSQAPPGHQPPQASSLQDTLLQLLQAFGLDDVRGVDASDPLHGVGMSTPPVTRGAWTGQAQARVPWRGAPDVAGSVERKDGRLRVEGGRGPSGYHANVSGKIRWGR